MIRFPHCQQVHKSTIHAESGYPTLRPLPSSSRKVDLHDSSAVILHGLHSNNANVNLQPGHPLQSSEEKWYEHQMKLDYVMLKNSQGISTPLKMQMERHVASQMMRLPCLHSSNIMLDTLTGRDEIIDFEDILNNPADSEVMGQPHLMMEKRLHLI